MEGPHRPHASVLMPRCTAGAPAEVRGFLQPPPAFGDWEVFSRKEALRIAVTGGSRQMRSMLAEMVVDGLQIVAGRKRPADAHIA